MKSYNWDIKIAFMLTEEEHGMKIECLPVGWLKANCYVVSDEETKKAAVIDPGGNPEIILGYLEENGLTCEAILLTHAHDDHTKGVYGVMEPTGARVYMNRGDVGLTVRRTGLCFQEPEDTVLRPRATPPAVCALPAATPCFPVTRSLRAPPAGPTSAATLKRSCAP